MCAGGTVTFTLTASNGVGYCPSTDACTSTFTVTPSAPVDAHCATAVTVPACTPAAEIASAYAAWVAGFSVDGGCFPTSNIATIPAYRSEEHTSELQSHSDL